MMADAHEIPTVMDSGGQDHRRHSQGAAAGSTRRGTRRSTGHGHRRAPRFNFKQKMDLEGTNYDVITSVGYLNEKYGLRKSHYIEKFIKCIHRKINVDASKISSNYIESLNPWVKSKLFLLLVALSERGGPEYWLDKNEPKVNEEEESHSMKQNNNNDNENNNDGNNNKEQNEKVSSVDKNETDTVGGGTTVIPTDGNDDNNEDPITTLTEHIIQQNINRDFKETTYDENYVFSSIWANFMEGLINHYLERIIVPHSEMKVCQQLYKPMMKIISLYNEYNELIEKSERNGFLPIPGNHEDGNESGEIKDNIYNDDANNSVINNQNNDDLVSQERLQRAQKLLWQARQDIPKTISKELTLLSEMYSTLSADEQDYELDEFVCCAEEYIESEFLPGLVTVLFANCGSNAFWKTLLVLEPFFYYIEDVGESEDEEGDEETDLNARNLEVSLEDISDITTNNNDSTNKNNGNKNRSEKRSQSFKPDPRVITLEKICEVAAKQKWI